MKAHSVAMLTLLLVSGRGHAIAQDTAPERTQAVDSFARLSSVLSVGQDIVVRQGAGRSTRGKVVSVSDHELVVTRSGWFQRQRQEMFSESGVTSIDLVDSKWDGAALGALLAVGAVGVMVETDCRQQGCDDEFGRAGRWVLGGIPFVSIGFGIGAIIDGAHARSVFVRQSAPPRIAIAPWIGRDTRAVLAQVRF